MNENNIIKDVQAIAQSGQPDNDITQLLLKHNCLYLLSKVLLKNDITLQLPAMLSLNSLAVKERYESCREVFQELGEIKYAVIKGAVLSQKIYGNVSYRRSSDIDILIERENADKVKERLLSHGFIQGWVDGDNIVPFTRQELLYHTALSHQMAPFIKRTGRRFCPFVNIDVNLDIMWGESKRKADMCCVLSELGGSEIFGVKVKTLNPVMEFISLCLHHYKDINSIYLLAQGSLKLSLFCDIYYGLINTEIDAGQLADVCRKLDVSVYVYYCVYYANQVFSDARLNSYLAEVETVDCGKYLNLYGLDDNERRKWDIEFTTRLFDDDFIQRLQTVLTEKDREKITSNRNFMH